MPDNFKANRKAARRRQRGLDRILNASACLEKGLLDHHFENEDAKKAMRADLKRQATELITAELKATPGLYKQLPDGRWEIFPDADRKILSLDDK